MCISPLAFGEDVIMEYQRRMNFRKMRQIVEESASEIIDSESTTSFLVQGTDEFINYCNSNKKTEKYIRDTFAIFDIEGSHDLAFTIYGIQKISGAKLIKYDQISCKGNKLMLDGTSYKVSGINNFAFEELCETLSAFSEDINRWSLYFNTPKKELTATTIVATAALGIPGAVAATAASAAGFTLSGVAMTAAGAVGAAGAAIGSAIKKATNKSTNDIPESDNESKAEEQVDYVYKQVVGDSVESGEVVFEKTKEEESVEKKETEKKKISDVANDTKSFVNKGLRSIKSGLNEAKKTFDDKK